MRSTPRATSDRVAHDNEALDPVHRIEYLIGFRIRMLDGLLAQHAKKITRQTVDMNRAEWFMMLELGVGGSLSPHEIAQRTGMERSHVTAAVRKLVQRELVVASRIDSDGRRVRLALTPRGKSLLRRGFDAYAPRRAALAAALTAHEQTVLDRALTKLIRVAEELLKEQQPGQKDE